MTDRPLIVVTMSEDSTVTKNDNNLTRLNQCWQKKLPYKVWKRQFMNDRMCNEEDLWKEVFFALLPHFVIAVILIVYLIVGAIIFQAVDEEISKEPLHEVVFFTFTTITTIGYGRVVPRCLNGQIFCIIYIIFGIPLAFLSLANLGRWLSDAYWILVDSFKQDRNPTPKKHRPSVLVPRRLPLAVAIALLLNHSLIGGLIFRYWIDDIPFIDGLYFSFISITTIGFGDIVPRPIDAWHTTASILYLTSGIVIMSALVARLLDYLRALHYIGRDFRGAAEVDVWFGGKKVTVYELLQIVAQHFQVSPSDLKKLLRDLDNVICETHQPGISVEESGIESGGKFGSLSQRSSNLLEIHHALIRQHSEPPNQHDDGQFLNISSTPKRSISECQLRRICVRNENEDDISEQVLRALGMVHHVAHSESSFRLKRTVEREKERLRRKSGIY